MSKKITIADIAKAVKLSPTTVSFVLNNRKDKGIGEETKNLVVKKALELGYRKLTQSNFSNRTRIAYLTSNIQYFNFHTSFFSEVYSHLESRAFEHKMEFFLLELKIDENDSEMIYSRLQEIRSMAIDVFLCNSPRIMAYLKNQNLKSILIQGGRTNPDWLCIYCDDFNAGKLAAEHAWENGHTKAGMIFPEGSKNSARFKGFYDTFTAQGGKCLKKFIWLISGNHQQNTDKIVEWSTGKNSLPTFFYCFADNVMFPAIRGFAQNGLEVPDDISLIGADNLYWGQFTTPAFTTVDLCEELFAEKVIEGIKHILIDERPYHLAVRFNSFPAKRLKNLSDYIQGYGKNFSSKF